MIVIQFEPVPSLVRPARAYVAGPYRLAALDGRRIVAVDGEQTVIVAEQVRPDRWHVLGLDDELFASVRFLPPPDEAHRDWTATRTQSEDDEDGP